MFALHHTLRFSFLTSLSSLTFSFKAPSPVPAFWQSGNRIGFLFLSDEERIQYSPSPTMFTALFERIFIKENFNRSFYCLMLDCWTSETSHTLEMMGRPWQPETSLCNATIHQKIYLFAVHVCSFTHQFIINGLICHPLFNDLFIQFSSHGICN